ncbi:amino acid ABC transporter permease [Arthrobacter pigmenti]
MANNTTDERGIAMTTSTGTKTGTDIPQAIAGQRNVSWWVSGLIVAAVAAFIAQSLYVNPNIAWAVVGEFILSPRILNGLWTTLELAVLSQAIAVLLGLVISLMRLSSNPVAGAVSRGYIWLFRGTPLLVQILLWGNFALFYDQITLGIPFTGITFASWPTNEVITTFVAAVLGLALHEAAYMAEIIRSGIMSVGHGQTEAAQALGLTRGQLMSRVVVPQALRIIVPPTGNQFIQMLKMTSLVAVIAGGDLLTVAQNISAVNLQTIELLIVATVWYLLVTSIASAGQALLERRLGRSIRRQKDRGKKTARGRSS